MHDLITKASPANFSPLFIMAFTVLPWLDMVCFGLPVLGFPVLCTGVAYDELRIHTSFYRGSAFSWRRHLRHAIAWLNASRHTVLSFQNLHSRTCIPLQTTSFDTQPFCVSPGIPPRRQASAQPAALLAEGLCNMCESVGGISRSTDLLCEDGYPT